jgi:hypothetical protein
MIMPASGHTCNAAGSRPEACHRAGMIEQPQLDQARSWSLLSGGAEAPGRSRDRALLTAQGETLVMRDEMPAA